MYNISVIIAVYNAEKYISRAIRSCLGQTLPKTEYEIIVVNDGSTDKTSEILKTFEGFYHGITSIKRIDFKDNKGLSVACNEGIRKAIGQYIVRVDADDYVNERILEVEELFLNMNKDFNAVACDYFLVDEHENIITRMNCDENPIACGVMFRKDNLIEAGLYNEDLRVWEDIDLRKRFFNKFSIHRIPLPLYRYRQHKGSLTNP